VEAVEAVEMRRTVATVLFQRPEQVERPTEATELPEEPLALPQQAPERFVAVEAAVAETPEDRQA
jgi:hypothetical protein